MAKKTLNIGIVGYGFMGRTHANAYHNAAKFFDTPLVPVLKAACGRDAGKLRAYAENWGFESTETDWRKLVARKDIDAIDIVTPNDSHAEIAIAAARAGKMVLCEKPLALTGAQGEKMVAEIERAGVVNTVWYNYRRIPAVTLAKQIIDSGKLGQIFHYRANFLQDWTISADLPQGGAGLWRLDAKAAGSGVTGDLLAHCIDTAIWLNGRLTDVSAMTETFIKKRKHTLTGKVEEVKIDDAAIFHGHFANGSLALFESTRYARGHKALYTLEINGANASIRWDLHDLHRLQYFDHSDEGIVRGWRSVHVTDSDQPYMKNWWVPGLQIGYAESFTHQVADFLKAAGAGKPCPPTFRDALETQYVCDAVLESARKRKWVDVKSAAKLAKPGKKSAADAMKWVALVVIGFVLGMAAGHLRQRARHFELPSIPALSSLREMLPGVVPRGSGENPTLRAAIEPVYEVLFGPLDDGKAVAVALEETAEIEKMMARLPADEATVAARGVLAMMKAAVGETGRFSKAAAQPVSAALGGEGDAKDFFGSVFEKRWRANMGALAMKAAPEWRRFVDIDALTPCPEKSQVAIASLLGERRLRELERTAIRIYGSVLAVMEGGALVETAAPVETVFVSAFPNADTDTMVSVMAHPAGRFQYTTQEGARRDVRKLRFFRHTDKSDAEKAARGGV